MGSGGRLSAVDNGGCCMAYLMADSDEPMFGIFNAKGEVHQMLRGDAPGANGWVQCVNRLSDRRHKGFQLRAVKKQPIKRIAVQLRGIEFWL